MPTKPVDRHLPETASLNKLNRGQERQGCSKASTEIKKGRVVFHYLFCVEMVSSVSRGVTCCMLIPDFDRAVMGGCSHSSCATRMHGEKHTAGCGLEVASVLHNFAARLTQVPELVTHRHKSTHHKSQCFMFQKHRQNQWSV